MRAGRYFEKVFSVRARHAAFIFVIVDDVLMPDVNEENTTVATSSFRYERH